MFEIAELKTPYTLTLPAGIAERFHAEDRFIVWAEGDMLHLKRMRAPSLTEWSPRRPKRDPSRSTRVNELVHEVRRQNLVSEPSSSAPGTICGTLAPAAECVAALAVGREARRPCCPSAMRPNWPALGLEARPFGAARRDRKQIFSIVRGAGICWDVPAFDGDPS